MFKLFDQYNNTIQFTESFNVVSRNISPFKEFLKKNDFSAYSVSIDEEKFSLKDAFLFQVNVMESGTIYAVFKKEGFVKEEVAIKLSTLAEQKVTDLSSAKEKTSAALSILDEYQPIMFVYVQKNEHYLDLESLRDSYSGNVTFFVIEKKQEGMVTSEYREKKKVKEKKKFSLIYFFAPIKENKYHFIFLAVATFLVGFAFAIGIYNAKLSKGIAVLFFICSFAGLFLNTYIYLDYFKTKELKDPLFRYSVAFNTIGLVLSVFAFWIYYSIDKSEGKEATNLVTLMIIGFLVGLGLTALTVGIALLFTKKKK